MTSIQTMSHLCHNCHSQQIDIDLLDKAMFPLENHI